MSIASAGVRRMAGRSAPPWCPHCHAPPGRDCPDRGRTSRQIRRALQRQLRRELAGELRRCA